MKRGRPQVLRHFCARGIDDESACPGVSGGGRGDRAESGGGAGCRHHQRANNCRQRPGDRVGHHHRARGEDRLRQRRRGAYAGAARDRRQGHERHAGLHRRPQARQQRRERGGADAVAARGRLHDRPCRRRSGGGQHRAARPDRQGRVHRAADHRVGPDQPPADPGRSASGGAGAGREGNQAHRRNRPDAGARSAAVGDRSPQGDRGRGEEGRRAGQRARCQQPRDGRGRGCGRDAPGAPAEQGFHHLRAGRKGGAGRGDRRGPDRVRRAEHRHPVAGAGAGAVAEGQHAALPRRQAMARGHRRRQPRPERPRDRHRGRLHDHQRAPHLGRRSRTIRRSGTRPIRTPPTSSSSSTS